MIKKITATFLTIMMVLTSFCFPVSAKSNSPETSTSSISSDFWEAANIRLQSDAVVLSRTMLLEEGNTDAAAYTLGNGQEPEYEYYANEIVMVLPKEDCSAEDVYNELCEKYDTATSRAMGNKTESDRDSSISIEATLTIYYTRTVSNNMPYVKLTKVEGGFTQLDRQVKVVSQVVSMGCTGWAAGGVKTQDLSLLDYGDMTSWSENMPSAWVAVAENGSSIFAVGANVTFTLRRKSNSNYTWKLYLENNL